VQLLIIGLDGATFDRLNPWIDAGHLKTVEQLIKGGAWTRLHSTIPPLTAPAWSTFATGLNPGRHSVFNFSQPTEQKPGERVLCDSRHVRGVRFWKVLNHAGARVGIVDLPMFFPPEEVEGLMVSDVISSGWKKALTYPTHLKADLKSALPDVARTLSRPLINGIMTTSTYLRKLISSLGSKEALDLYLIRRFKCDVFMTVYSHTDVFQHHFWHVIDETHPRHETRRAGKLTPLVETFIRRLDETISHLIEASRSRNVVLISDHGFGPARRVIYVNSLLRSLDYLHTKSDYSKGKTLTPGKIKRLATAVDFFGFRKFISKNRRKRIREFLSKALFPEIDWNRTQAHLAMQGDYGIWINRKTRFNLNGPLLADEEYAKLLDRLVVDLRQAKDPENGAPLFEEVYRREDVFVGPYVEYAPDIMLQPALGYIASSDLSNEITGYQPRGLVTGFHRPEGIFVAWGPDIQPGRLDQARIEDAAPTLLYLAGSPVPDGLDGHVMEVMTPAYKKAHPVSFFDASALFERTGTDQADLSDMDERAAIERLRSLGYLQ
jgi:predicted AlkP superfamily phosphohydrolase/phosphomutase